MRLTIGDLVLEVTDEQADSLREQLGNMRPHTSAPLAPESLLNVAAVARRLRVSEDYVRDHAEELGGRQLGGKGSPWRFDLGAMERASHEPPEPAPKPRAAKRRGRPKKERLLAVRGAAPYAGPELKAAPASADTLSEGLPKEA